MSTRKPDSYTRQLAAACSAEVARAAKTRRAEQAVIRAARRQIRTRGRFMKGGSKWDHWIDAVNAEEKALARLDKITGRAK